MAGIIGQICYNVNGIANSANITEDKLFAGIIGDDDPKLIPSSNKIIKLGVQAEPGTKFAIKTAQNSDNETVIVVGRSGIYELDERIPVYQLRIIPTYRYLKDEDGTKKAQQAAVNAFKDLGINGYDDDNNPETEEPTWDEDKINAWVTKYQSNTQKFNEGYIKYLQGLNGVYVIATDENNDKIHEPIHNLIIDYVYESANS